MVDEVLEMIVDRAGKIHHVTRVTVANGGQHKQLVWHQPSGAVGDSRWANNIDVEWQMMPVLFDRATRHETHLAHVDRVIDLRPGEFFVAKFSGGAAHGFSEGPS